MFGPRIQGVILSCLIAIAVGTWGYVLRGSLSTPNSTPALPMMDTGMIILSLTGSVDQTGSTVQTREDQNLTLYMPESWYTPGRSRVIGQMKGQGIDLTIVTYRDLFFQKKLIDQDILSSEIDIVMIDSDHVSVFSGRGQTLVQDQSLASFVHHSIGATLASYPYFFARGLDPAVLLTNTPIDRPVTIDYIRNLQTITTDQNTLYIPVLIGDTLSDQQMIQAKTHPILDAYMSTRIIYHNNTSPSYTATTQQVLNTTNKYWSSGYMLKIQDYVLKKTPNCSNLLGLCMLSKNMTTLVPAFWSDRRHYFDLTEKQPITLPFPHRTITYPCKTWGFVVNKQTIHKQEALTLLKILIGSLNRFDFDLYDGNLSAYQQLLDIQLQSKTNTSWQELINNCTLLSK